MAAAPEREQDPEPRPAFDLTLSFYPPAISLKIADRQLAGYALAGLGIGCGVALVAFFRNHPGLVENAVRTALQGPGVQVANIAPGSILVELRCDTRESFSSFMEGFETEQVKQRLKKEFARIGYNEELDVTITNKNEVYQKLDVIRKRWNGASMVDERLEQLPGDIKARKPTAQAFTEGARTIFPSGTVLLSTKMRYGVISYKTEDVTIWENDKKWRVSSEEARRLKNDWKTTPTAQLELLTDRNGVVKIKVKDVSTFTERYCSIF